MTFHKKLLIVSTATFFVVVGLVIKTLLPDSPKAANFTNASATLGNSRFSFVGGVATGTSGSSNVTIDTTGNPDKDVDHLFPKDTVCFAPSQLSGCTGNKFYTVASTEGADGDQFTLSEALSSTLNATDLVYATASGSLVISVTLTNAVPNGGDLLITIPMANSANGNDGFADYATTVAAGGFDLNGIAAADISVATSTSGTCDNAHWTTTETIAPGSGSTDHTIRIDRSGSECQANTTVLTITIDSAPGIVNPAPINTTRTQGVADAYTINIKSRDNTDATIDNSNVMVAPIEGVFVSATVQETLSFTVAGEAAASGKCNLTTDVTTTATAIPWGTISTSNAFLEASQVLTLSTNANAGYSVKIDESDQMGKDGVTCTGVAPSAGHFTFSAATCIRDSVCGATPCTESAGYGWTDATTYPGMGFSLEDVDGTDASFVYNSNDPCGKTAAAGTFCARQIADIQGGETAQSIMANTGPVDSKDVRVCFRITVPGTQPAGYYYNKVKYTAIPTF
jgi:hypothetical protein